MVRTLGKEWKKVAVKLMGEAMKRGECFISADALKEACAMTYFCLPDNSYDDYDRITAPVREEISDAIDSLTKADSYLKDETSKPLFCVLDYYKDGKNNGLDEPKKCFVVNADRPFADFKAATKGISEDVHCAMQNERTLAILGVSNYEDLNSRLGQQMTEEEKDTIMTVKKQTF